MTATTTTRPPALDDATEATLAQALANVREELGRATATALGVAGTAATIAAVALAALMAGQWSPDRLTTAGEILWWAGVSAAAAGMAWLGAVTLPRMPPAGAGPPVNWGPIAAHRLPRQPGQPRRAAPSATSPRSPGH